jgi:cytochrome c oxidase assembly protein subunit 15
MVKSGLSKKIIEDNTVPRVSQYRLAAHLGMASTILVVTLHSAFKILFGIEKSSFVRILKIVNQRIPKR